MLPQTQSSIAYLRPSILPGRPCFPRPQLFYSKSIINRTHSVQLKANPYRSFLRRPLKCSVSVVSEPAQLELTNNNDKPLPAEVCKTIVELSSVATLSAVTQEGWPLGIGVRFTVDSQGNPVLCLDDSIRKCFTGSMSSLHVQLEQSGFRTAHCSVMGNLEKPGDKLISKKLHAMWQKKFGEEVDENLIYFISVQRVHHMEDFGEDGLWVTPTEYKLASPDPLRDFAEKLVEEINTHNGEDVYRFCNIYADLDFQLLDAKMVWVDRLGFDIRVRSTQNDVFEVRIPFPGEVTDEKGAKSCFNCMSQLAWEVEKNFQVPDFKKVKHLKMIACLR